MERRNNRWRCPDLAPSFFWLPSFLFRSNEERIGVKVWLIGNVGRIGLFFQIVKVGLAKMPMLT